MRERYEIERPEVIIDRVVFRKPPATVELLYNHKHEILGFLACNIVDARVQGSQYAIFDAGMYVRPGVRGLGWMTYRRAVSEALRYKLKHPRAKLVSVTAMMTPISYIRACGWPGLFPRVGEVTPPVVEAVVRHAARERGFHHVGQNPWQVNVGFRITPRDPERVRTAVAKRRGTSVDHYLTLNPSYLEGDWLLVYAPLDLHTIVRAIFWNMPREWFKSRKQRHRL